MAQAGNRVVVEILVQEKAEHQETFCGRVGARLWFPHLRTASTAFPGRKAEGARVNPAEPATLRGTGANELNSRETD